MSENSFEDFNKKINLTWFYPKICKFQDDLESQGDYFRFLEEEPEKETPLLLYIHIPFCESLCAYCACFKEPLQKYSYEDRKLFVEALVKEMEMYSRKPFTRRLKVNYIQFGGGTPSCLDNDLLERIFQGIRDNFDLSENKGISLEGNVMTLQDTGKIQLLKDVGVSRVSFGVQTFNERIRKELAIKATLGDIDRAVETLRKVGISYALDLIYNLPDQDFEMLQTDLDKACKEINPVFIQTYQFNQFHNTVLKNKIDRGYFKIVPTHEREAEMFGFIMDRLEQNGYGKQVLINLFSDRVESPWTGIELSLGNNRLNGSYMLGLGAGSMSYISGRSFRTCCSVRGYMDMVGQGKIPAEAGHVCPADEAENKVMALFPNFTKIKIKDIPNIQRFEEKIEFLLKEGLAEKDKDSLYLTRKGKIWAGNISYFFYSENELKRLQTSFYNSLKHKKNTFNQDSMNVVNG